jgi:hypothetical protein
VRLLLRVSTPFGTAEGADIAQALLPDSAAGVRFVSISRDSVAAAADKRSDAGDIADGGMKDGEPSIAEAAREAALAFNLVLAAELWRRAADELTGSEAVVFRPEAVADVLMEAGAASADAGERSLALRYFRRAVAVYSEIRPGPAISPGAKALFEDGRQQGPVLLEIPRDAVLEEICRATDTDGLVWVAIGRDDQEWAVSYKLYISGETASELETRRHAAPFDGHAAAVERERFEGILARKLLGDAALRRPLIEIEPVETGVAKPWYRRWWVYAIGGALIAGGAAGVATWLVVRPEEATVTAHY